MHYYSRRKALYMIEFEPHPILNESSASFHILRHKKLHLVVTDLPSGLSFGSAPSGAAGRGWFFIPGKVCHPPLNFYAWYQNLF